MSVTDSVINKFYDDIKNGDVVVKDEVVEELCATFENERPLLNTFLRWIIKKDFIK